MDLPQLLQQDLLHQKPDPCCSTTIQSLQQHAVDEFSNTSETSVIDVDELHAISAWKILSIVDMSIIREIARKKRSVQKSPYLDNEFLEQIVMLKDFYFAGWPLAKFGFLWMIASPPTWQNWKNKKPLSPSECGAAKSAAFKS
jgi:hypothetical protein